ncbi:MAG: 4Fe-4S binding protein [Defluviitaleaceae bacterium]|nr:4Fe-4S binding protein [Defluviitaleaceae bacterium]
MAIDYSSLKKGGFMRQVQKDYFSMRLKVVGGNLTADQLTAIAEISKKYGKGYVHLTARQGVEVPFIKSEDIEAVKSELESKGVYTGFCGPQVRTVTACQGSEVCPAGCIDTQPLAQKIADRYQGRELPHKFKIGITACPNNCLKAEENDIGIKGGYAIEWIPENCVFCGVCEKACRRKAITQADDTIKIDTDKCNCCGRCVKSCPVNAWNFEPGYILSFGGTFGNLIAKGEQCLPMIHDLETFFRVTDAALDFFDHHANPSERFRITIERVGWDQFKREIEDSYHR